jgi:hypothetical protein
MKGRLWLLAALLLPGLAAVALTADRRPAEKAGDTKVTWKKIVLDRNFHSEGVAVADVNKDGKLDILAGDVWYEGPDFQRMHVLRQGGRIKPRYDPLGYSQSFCCWADDLNGDGYPDLIVIGFPGEPCHWYENPGKTGRKLWQEHEIWHSACNETPQYADLFGNGKRVLVMAFQPRGKEHEGQMAWFAPGKDPTQPWEMHPISEPSSKGREVPGTFRYSHGLGIGDVNGDGRPDVICTGGWWEQPAKDTGKPWTFHPAGLGPDCADMFCYDLNGDGKADVVSSSAHAFGIWWHEQKPGQGGNPTFLRHDLFPKLFSESHALHCVDIDGDGLKDLVTGRRWWAHGPKGDPGADGPAVLYWFQAKRGKDGVVRFIPHLIDDDSGVGTQFAIADLNGDGLPDIIISNKKGVFAFLQVRPGAEARKDG